MAKDIVQGLLPDEAALEIYLNQTLVGYLNEGSPWTIGIEHEFFLESDGFPAPQKQSQSMFEGLLDRGWKEQTREDFGQGDILAAVTPPYCPQTVLKYEHHPYLLEVAFHFDSSLERLEELVAAVFRDIDDIAAAVGVDICHRPFCSVEADHPLTMGQSPMSLALRDYRQRLLESQGKVGRPALLNFSSVIAATQIHIGGTRLVVGPEVLSSGCTVLNPISSAWPIC